MSSNKIVNPLDSQYCIFLAGTGNFAEDFTISYIVAKGVGRISVACLGLDDRVDSFDSYDDFGGRFD